MQNKKKKNNNRFTTLISRIIATLLLAITIFSVIFIIKINILPIKYLILLIVLLTVIIGEISYITLHSKLSKKIKIVFSIISFLIICVFIVGLMYGFNTLGFIDKLKSKNYNIQRYYVIVLKESNYNDIKDLNDKTMLIYNNSTSGMNSLIENIENIVKPKITNTDDLNNVVSELLSKKVDSIVIDELLKEIIDEEDAKFKNKAKIIYTIEITVKITETKKEVNITEQPFNIYISGIDTYGNIASTSRSDVNIIATVNPKTKQVLLTNIPRDYYVQLHNTTGYKDKLTHAGVYGIDMSIKTIEDLLGIEINYYIKINFTSLIKIVDTIGGIDVYSKYAFTSMDGYKFKQGYNHTNGQQALSFSRERKSFAEGDRVRGENQQAVIAAIIKKVSSPTIITKYNSILKALEGSFEINISSQNIFKLIKMQLNDMALWNVTSISLNGTGSYEYTYTYRKQKLYVMIPIQETIDNVKSMIAKVFNGEVLSGSYEDMTNVNDVETVNNKPSQGSVNQIEQINDNSNNNNNGNIDRNHNSNNDNNDDNNTNIDDNRDTIENDDINDVDTESNDEIVPDNPTNNISDENSEQIEDSYYSDENPDNGTDQFENILGGVK